MSNRLRKKIIGAVCLLLVSAVLLGSASYAWLVLSARPEVTSVTTNISANGTLEIALATTEHLRQLQENDMYEPEGAEFVMANGDAVHDNVLWGNLVDVMSADYGLYTLDMRPAMLNVVDGAVAEVPVSLAGYGADGRMEAFDMDRIDIRKIGMSAVFDKEKARPVAGTVTMDRASLEAGLLDKEAVLQNLLDNMQYGVRVAGPLTYNGSYDLQSENITVDLVVDGYCFALDLLVRTNAPVANLMLQTEGALRVQTDDELLLEEYQGQGSFIDLQNPLMTAALNVVFADTLTGKVYAVAQPNPEDGKLWITFRADANGELVATAPEDSAMILPLTQNRVTALTAWVYLNGNLVQNASAMTRGAMELLMNLQFSTDAVLNPAYTDENAEHSYADRPEFSVPTLPTTPGETVDPSAPSTPTNPSDPIEAGTFYLENRENGSYSIYALDSSGNRTYDLQLSGVVSENNQTLTINSIQNYPENGIVIPAIVSEPDNHVKYFVRINNEKPFSGPRLSNASLAFVPVDGDKVDLVSSSMQLLFKNLSSLYDGVNFASIDLRGLNTSGVTDMSHLFEECDQLTTVYLDGLDTSNVTNMSYMFDNCRSLNSLDMTGLDTSNVTSMGHMFKDCTKLTHLTMSGLNTSKVTNMVAMFSGCSQMVTLDLTGFDTPLVTYMSYMFYDCRNLTNLDVSSFDTHSVKDMSNMFNGCAKLTSLNVTDFVTSSVTDMSSMFNHCESLINLDVSVFDTSSVTDMSGMFASCAGLSATDFGRWDTSKVQNMGYMFYNCSEVNIEGIEQWDTSSVTNMNCMFSYCSNLTNVDMSGWDISKVEETVMFFTGCAKLDTIVTPKASGNISIDLPASYRCAANGSVYTVLDQTVPAQSVLTKVTGDKPVSTDTYFLEADDSGSYSIYRLNADGSRAVDTEVSASVNASAKTVTVNSVQDCADTGIVIPAVVEDVQSGAQYDVKLNPSAFANVKEKSVPVSVVEVDGKKVVPTGTSLAEMFRVSSHTAIDLRGLDTRNVTNMHAMFYSCGNLKTLDLHGLDTSQVNDMSYLICACYNLSDLDISGFDTSNVTDMRMMFSTTALTTLDVSSFNTSKVELMTGMFNDCDYLTALDLSNFNTSRVTNMVSMFNGCVRLEQLDLSSFNTSGVTDMNSMFSGCSGLTNLDVSGFETTKVTDMSFMFNYCSSLTSLDVRGFDTAQVIDMNDMFSGCKGLTSLDVSSFDTAQVTDMSYMFSGCTGLTEMKLQSFDTRNVTDMSYMFNNCKNVKSWYIKNFDTSKVTNMSHTFYNCLYLITDESFYFDISNVTDMSYLFYGCVLTRGDALDLTNLDVSSATDMRYMFANTCPLGGSLDISNWDLSKADTTGMFNGCGASVIRPA